jgi:diguanylate cyclase (GGDEF)-like protein
MNDNDSTQGQQGRLLYFVENLASLHGAPDLPWLTGRFEFLGEHALGARLTALLLPDEAGTYRPSRSAATRPAVADTLWEELGVNSLSTSAQAATVFARAENSTSPLPIALADLVGEKAEGHTDDALIAPLVFNRESIGLGLFIGAETDVLASSIAATLCAHAAVAIYQLRERENARRLHSVDPHLWIPDEDFLRSQMQREVTRARRYGRELGIALLRLDNEAAVRAKFGDFYTQHLLRRIGGQLLAGVRDTDVLGALGGGYAILHTDTGAEGTNISAYRLRDSITKMVRQRFPEAPEPDIGARIASYPAHGSTVEALIRHLQEGDRAAATDVA